MFIDEARITIEGGKGGDGSASFRHEKYVPLGGPDGGDGGNGGNVVFVADPSTHGLDDFRSKLEFTAEAGENGMKSKKHGRQGEDLLLRVPPGTVLFEAETNLQLADLTKTGDKYIAVKGGNGGWGNVHFVGPINQTPERANKGLPGDKKEIKLEIRFIADVGIIGKPNAGKSTLISAVSQARPAIADYAFTSLDVTLGRVSYFDHTFTMADIPGLIERSSQGRGLGIKFLKHILRTRVLVHLISSESGNPTGDYQMIRLELGQFNKTLLQKPEIVVISKSELVDTEMLGLMVQELSKDIKLPVLTVSAATGSNVEELLGEVVAVLDKQPQNI